MTCKLAGTPIGSTLIGELEDETCAACGFSQTIEGEFIYAGHEEVNGIKCHKLLHKPAYICPECGARAVGTYSPCEGGVWTIELPLMIQLPITEELNDQTHHY